MVVNETSCHVEFYENLGYTVWKNEEVVVSGVNQKYVACKVCNELNRLIKENINLKRERDDLINLLDEDGYRSYVKNISEGKY